MDTKQKILAISGSTRSGSSNLMLLNAMENLAEDSEFIYYYELEKLPYFNPDVDKQSPPEIVLRFRHLLEEADGVIICTPEYVFSLPGALKNALEWTVSTTLFSNKPVALITASASGEKAHESLLLIMQTLQAKIEKEATLLIPGIRAKINAKGEIIHKETLEYFKKVLRSLIVSIEK